MFVKNISRIACRAIASVGLLLLGGPAIAGFSNGGFETGDYTGWTVNHLKNPGTIPSFPPTAYGNLGLTSDSSNGYLSLPVKTDVVGTGVDANSGNHIGYPAYGSYAARVNYGGHNNFASSISQTAVMQQSDVNPADGKVHIKFSFAPLLENPGHSQNQQPYFFIEIRNLTKNNAQLFYTFNFSNQSGVPWGTGVGDYLYTNWQSIDVAPGAGVLDVGDQVSLVIVASGCGPGGHTGQVYVDSGPQGTSLPGPTIAATGPTSAASVAATQITYTYTYGNTGTAPLTDAVGVIVPPQDNSSPFKNLSYVSNTAPSTGSCSVGSGTLHCNFGTLNPGQTGSLQVTYSIPSGATTPINNANYSLAGDNVSPVLGPLVQTTLTSTPLADLAATVSDGLSSTTWGSTLTYTAVISNNGPAAVSGASITETPPSSLAGETWTCAASGGATCPVASGSGAINQTGVALPAGAALTYTITGTASGTGTGTINEVVNVTAPGSVVDPNLTNNTAADVNNVGATLNVLTVGTTGNGQVTSVPSGVSCSSCTGATQSFPTGSTVILYAVAPTGSIFSGWSGSGAANCTTLATSCSVTLSADASVVANFVTPDLVTAAVSGSNGTVSPVNVAVPVTPGGSVSFTVNPGAGYAVVETDNCGASGGVAGGSLIGNTWTSNAIGQSACTVTFSFTNSGVVTITPSAGANGSISPTAAETVNSGASGSFTVLPNSGYTSATPAGSCPAGTWSGNVYTTGAATADCTVSFSFVSSTASYAITGIASPAAGGSISCAPASVAAGGSSSCTATANPYYAFSGFNGACTGTVCSLSNIQSAKAVTAVFLPIVTSQNTSIHASGSTSTNGSLTSLVSAPPGSTYSLSTGASHGTVVVNPNGSYVYTPSTGYFGNDTFSYQVCSGSTCSVSTVTIAIDPSGVVYDSQSRQAIAGATVTLMYNGSPVPAAWVTSGSATQTTNASGYYGYFFTGQAQQGTYSLSVSAAGYGPSPSTSIPPTAAPANYQGGSVGYAGVPPLGQTTTYYLSFPLPTVGITNDNIPLDSLAYLGSISGVPALSDAALAALALLMLMGGALSVRRKA